MKVIIDLTDIRHKEDIRLFRHMLSIQNQIKQAEKVNDFTQLVQLWDVYRWLMCYTNNQLDHYTMTKEV